MLIAILFENISVWWLPVCIAAGIIYAYIFYNKQVHGRLKYILFALRAILVSIICFLLMAPLFSSRKNLEEKPLLILAQDNSESIPLGKSRYFNLEKYQHDVAKLFQRLKTKYEVVPLRFGDGIATGEKPDFKDQQTDFSELFGYINDQYGNRNLGAVILASDGIVNKGTTVVAKQLPQQTAVYTIGLGDTTIKRDLLIRNINYNRIVYLDNEYPLEINLSAFRSKGEQSVLTITTSDGQKISKPVNVDDDYWRKTIHVMLNAKNVGLQKVNITLSPVAQEISEVNNTQTLYIEVLEGKEKILLLANAPHPDVNALKQSLSENKNYDIQVAFPYNLPKSFEPYNIIILHNLPSSAFPLQHLFQQNLSKPIWFIVGTETNINAFNQLQNIVKLPITASREYYPDINTNFQTFRASSQLQAFFKNLSPLTGPLGTTAITREYQVLIHQRASSGSPLLFYVKDNRNYAFLLGEGIWRWRLENYKETSDFSAFDELTSKTIQFLSVKEDKRKFRVFPVKQRFMANEEVLLHAELYNDNYEAVTSEEISMDVTHRSGKKYSYVFTKKESSYELNAGSLPKGEYRFSAKTRFNNKLLESKGEFVVEDVAAEHLNTTANHQFLYDLAHSSGGVFIPAKDLIKLEDLLDNNERITTIVHTDNTYKELIDTKWVFFLLMLLLSVEWFLRKRNGLL